MEGLPFRKHRSSTRNGNCLIELHFILNYINYHFMNDTICQPRLSLDQLVRIVESIVFLGPIHLEELTAHLLLTTKYAPSPDELQSVIMALTEKYSVYLYGIAFTANKDLLQFTCRRITDILQH